MRWIDVICRRGGLLGVMAQLVTKGDDCACRVSGYRPVRMREAPSRETVDCGHVGGSSIGEPDCAFQYAGRSRNSARTF